MNALYKSFFVMFFVLPLINCDNSHEHNESKRQPNFLWKSAFCASISSAELVDTVIKDAGGGFKRNLEQDRVSESLGTLCSAVVERKFQVDCGR